VLSMQLIPGIQLRVLKAMARYREGLRLPNPRGESAFEGKRGTARRSASFPPPTY